MSRAVRYKKHLTTLQVFLSIVLVLGLLLSLTGCGDSAKKQEILDFLNGCEGVSAEEVQ